MFDINVAAMKIGVAIPILNNSFRYWDDPGTWLVPSSWTKNAGIVTLREWTHAYDADDAAVYLVGSSVPDDNSVNLTSSTERMWPENHQGFPSGITCYYSWAVFINALSGAGANARVRLQIGVDSAQDFSGSPQWTTLDDVLATDTEIRLRTGTAVLSVTAADRWARCLLILRDATSIQAKIDCPAVMFNPFAPLVGYYAFTGWADNGPPATFQRYHQMDDTRQGVTRTHDPSGGAEKLVLPLSFRDESAEFYENMHGFFNLNKGRPGLTGVPLLLEPNLPGYPPTMMCNIVENEFPLKRQAGASPWYGGTVTFKSVY